MKYPPHTLEAPTYTTLSPSNQVPRQSTFFVSLFLSPIFFPASLSLFLSSLSLCFIFKAHNFPVLVRPNVLGLPISSPNGVTFSLPSNFVTPQSEGINCYIRPSYFCRTHQNTLATRVGDKRKKLVRGLKSQQVAFAAIKN